MAVRTYRSVNRDYAAAMLILHEAGGCIATWNGGAPSLTRPSLVIAANRAETLGTMLATVHLHLPDGVPYADRAGRRV